MNICQNKESLLNPREIIFSKKIDSILDRGINLNFIGIYNWAFTYEEILVVVEIFKKEGIDILGGDVYKYVLEEDTLVMQPNLFNKTGFEETLKYFSYYDTENDYFSIFPRVKAETSSRNTSTGTC